MKIYLDYIKSMYVLEMRKISLIFHLYESLHSYLIRSNFGIVKIVYV